MPGGSNESSSSSLCKQQITGKHVSAAKKECLSNLKKTQTSITQQQMEVSNPYEEKNKQFAIEVDRLKVLVQEKQNKISQIEYENYQFRYYINQLEQQATRLKEKFDQLEEDYNRLKSESNLSNENKSKLKQNNNNNLDYSVYDQNQEEDLENIFKYSNILNQFIKKLYSKKNNNLNPDRPSILSTSINNANLSMSIRNNSRNSRRSSICSSSGDQLNNSVKAYEELMPESLTKKKEIEESVNEQEIEEEQEEEEEMQQEEEEVQDEELEEEEEQEEESEKEEQEVKKQNGLEMIQEEEEEEEEEVEVEEETEEESEEDEEMEEEEESESEEEEETESEESESEEEEESEEDHIIDETHQSILPAPVKIIQDNTYVISDEVNLTHTVTKTPEIEMDTRRSVKCVTFEPISGVYKEACSNYNKTPYIERKNGKSILQTEEQVEVSKKSILKVRTSDTGIEPQQTITNSSSSSIEITKIRKSTSSKRNSIRSSMNRRRSQAFSLGGASSGPLIDEPIELNHQQESKESTNNQKSIFKSKQKESNNEKPNQNEAVNNYLEDLVEQAAETDSANKAQKKAKKKQTTSLKPPSTPIQKETSSTKKVRVNVPDTDSDDSDEEYAPKNSKKPPVAPPVKQTKAQNSKRTNKNVHSGSEESNEEESEEEIKKSTKQKLGKPPLPKGLPPLPNGKNTKRPLESDNNNVLKQSNGLTRQNSMDVINDSVNTTQSMNNSNGEPHSPNLNKLLSKKLKLSPESEDSEQNSMMNSLTEQGSARRARKNVSYKEIPLNSKIRRDKNNQICIKVMEKKSISNPNEDLAAAAGKTSSKENHRP